jgi:anti-sigma factor RsiW
MNHGDAMNEEDRHATDIACQELVELVTEYLEGTLDQATTAMVETHLVDCPGCTEYLRQMRATIDALGHVPVDTLSEDAKSTLLAAFRNFHVPGGSQT